MATAIQIWKDTFGALRRGQIRQAWLALDRVPDCPQCHGDGEPHEGFDDFVYWRGEEYRVCATCEGTGKV